MQQINLKIYDVAAHITSDANHLIAPFALMYDRFRIEDFAGLPRPPLEFSLLTGCDNAWGRPILVLDGHGWPMDGTKGLQSFAYDVILNAILAQVRSHLLIHAAVVAKANEAIILAGDSGHGKTTLALALVRRGYRILSDELAALGRADHLVHSFPRGLHIRPGTLERLGWTAPPRLPSHGSDTLTVDIEDLAPGCLAAPARVRHVIILNNLQQPNQETDESLERELGIFVDRTDPRLLEAARRIDGVTKVWETIEMGCPVIRIIARRRMATLKEIESACRGLQILILDVSKRALRVPAFDQPAELTPISKSQAVMELIRQFQPGHRSTLLEQGSSTQVFVELVDMIDQADSFQLRAGPLEETVDLIGGLS
jgi:hypothetical protein